MEPDLSTFFVHAIALPSIMIPLLYRKRATSVIPDC
jgi:hypothetical protein